MAATLKQEKAMLIYRAIMEEVKIRFQCIEQAIQGHTGFIDPIVQEFCYLQLRMLCELIAFGCLVIHGDITAADRLHKEYAADKIINELEKLHPDFYPQPVEQIVTNPHIFELKAIKEGFLKKKELIELYRHCGDTLHRGSLKKLLDPKKLPKVNFPRVIEATQKMSVLLNHHLLILSLSSASVMICMLRNKNDENRAQVAFAAKGIAPSQ